LDKFDKFSRFLCVSSVVPLVDTILHHPIPEPKSNNESQTYPEATPVNFLWKEIEAAQTIYCHAEPQQYRGKDSVLKRFPKQQLGNALDDLFVLIHFSCSLEVGETSKISKLTTLLKTFYINRASEIIQSMIIYSKFNFFIFMSTLFFIDFMI